MKTLFKLIPLLFVLAACQPQNQEAESEAVTTKPNIIIIYADDAGYGDVGVYGARGVETPNIDQLAAEGLVFTDAHCTAATCTPSRYSLLTGSYAFRNNAAILPGDAPLLIDPNIGTLPKMLQKNGYQTAVIGKWHLGLGRGEVNWNEKITPGPAEIGFDYSFLLPATGDRVPTVYVENQEVVNLDPDDPITISYEENISDRPTGLERPDLLKMKADTQHSQTIVNGISRIGYMKGGEAALWKDEEFADVLTGKVNDFISQNTEQPFFLYFALHDIHVPRAPNERFVGKSTMGPRGDAIAQMDWCVGEVMKTLAEKGLVENTILLFTSDNGPVLDDGYDDQAVELLGDHQPSGEFKGGKYSAFEAGTRVPTIIRWPGEIPAGEQSDRLLSQVDLYHSFAELLGYALDEKEAPDSFAMWDVWKGSTEKGRPYLVEEAFAFTVRKDGWKYITPATKAPDWLANKDIETGMSTSPQLYHLAEDIQETENVAEANSERLAKLDSLWQEIKAGPTRQ